MPSTIEYCQSNLPTEAREQITTTPVRILEMNCLEHCGHCYRRPFLVVDAEFVCGESHSQLLADVLNGVEP